VSGVPRQDGDPPPPSTFRLRRYHLLALVPAIGMLVGVPFANGVQQLVWGFPFLLLWILGWVLITSGVMWVLLTLDRRQEDDDGMPDEPGRA
jgi:hypothetical protein